MYFFLIFIKLLLFAFYLQLDSSAYSTFVAFLFVVFGTALLGPMFPVLVSFRSIISFHPSCHKLYQTL